MRIGPPESSTSSSVAAKTLKRSPFCPPRSEMSNVPGSGAVRRLVCGVFDAHQPATGLSKTGVVVKSHRRECMCVVPSLKSRDGSGGIRQRTSAAPQGSAVTAVRASLIQTLTVGTGVPPVQPSAGSLPEESAGSRVADYNRRFGLTPTPEHVCVLLFWHNCPAALPIPAGVMLRRASFLGQRWPAGQRRQDS